MRQSRESRAPSRPSQVPLTPRRIEVVRTYLALDDRAHFRAPTRGAAGVDFRKRAPCPVETYRRLYRDVGEPWFWHDRLDWSDAQLATHLARGDVGVWEVLVDGASAGYFELQRHADGGVEIVYFGLTPDYMGRGAGGAMLQRAVDEAWAMGATRVWLHTCTLDSAHALPNYTARGFRVVREERLEVEIEGKDVVSERMLG